MHAPPSQSAAVERPSKSSPSGRFSEKKRQTRDAAAEEKKRPKAKARGGVRALSSSKVPIECLSRICRQWELTASNISQRRRCRRIDSPLIFCRPTAAHHQSNSSTTTILTTSRFHVSFWAQKLGRLLRRRRSNLHFCPTAATAAFVDSGNGDTLPAGRRIRFLIPAEMKRNRAISARSRTDNLNQKVNFFSSRYPSPGAGRVNVTLKGVTS